MNLEHLEKLKQIKDVLDDTSSVYSSIETPKELRQAQISIKELITEVESSKEYKIFLQHTKLMREFYDLVDKKRIVFCNYNGNDWFEIEFELNKKRKTVDSIIIYEWERCKCFYIEPFMSNDHLCYKFVDSYYGFVQHLHIIGKWGNNDFVASLNNECFYITYK